MAERSPKWIENTVGKGKLLVTSNFSFSHSVFKRLVQQTHRNHGLFGKGLNADKCIEEPTLKSLFNHDQKNNMYIFDCA